MSDMKRLNDQRGAIQGTTIAIVLLALLLAGAIVFGVWAFVQYSDYKTNFDSKTELAVSEAVKEQADLDEKKFIEREKEPNRQFVGPADYGRVTFDYPKNWSVHEATDVSNSSEAYQAYLNPVMVPPVGEDQKFAIRVVIDDKSIDAVLEEYGQNVEDGSLRTSSVTVNGVPGTRIDGKFTETIRGSAVLFKIRDKTLTVRTDSDAFKNDFEKLIKTIRFNQ